MAILKNEVKKSLLKKFCCINNPVKCAHEAPDLDLGEVCNFPRFGVTHCSL